jgi:hypothetical protein
MTAVTGFFTGLFDVISGILVPSTLGPVEIVIWAGLTLGFIPFVVKFIKSWF